MSKETVREKQIEKLADAIYTNCPACLLAEEAEMIARFAVEEQGYHKQEWISVEERLPKETETELEIIQGKDKTTLTAKVSEFVLIYSEYPENPYVTVDRTIDGVWSNNWYVTHWMPLPEAPKMKGGTE